MWVLCFVCGNVLRGALWIWKTHETRIKKKEEQYTPSNNVHPFLKIRVDGRPTCYCVFRNKCWKMLYSGSSRGKTCLFVFWWPASRTKREKGGTKLSRPHKLFTRFLHTHTHALWSWEEDPFITVAVLSCRGSSWFRGFSSFLSRNHPWQQHKMLRAHQQGGHSGSMPRWCSCFSHSEKNTRIRHNLIRHLVEQQVSTGAGILSETDQARSAFKSKLTDFDGRSFQMPPTTTFRLAYCLRVVLYHVFVHSTG